jgi:DNA-binding LacI/PurR family transcriptional regulator
MLPSQQDIAEHLGLSRSTVSRALGRDPRIPVKTRKRIEKAARDLGYRPNLLMSEIASSHWQQARVAKGSTIAYIECTRPEARIGRDLGSATRQRAMALGYNLENFSRIDFSSSGKLQTALRNRGITDVILGPTYEKSLTVELDWSKFICVQLLPGMFPLPLHSVIADYYGVVILAWRQAVEHGYRRIGITLMDHPITLMDDVIRLSAVDACQKYLFGHLPVLEPFHFRRNEFVAAAFVSWVKRNKPEVVIGFNHRFHLILRAEFPKQIPFINLHKSDEMGLTGIPASADVYETEGVNLLHFCRRTHQWGIPEQRIDHVLEPIWFEGNSLPRKI